MKKVVGLFADNSLLGMRVGGGARALYRGGGYEGMEVGLS